MEFRLLCPRDYMARLTLEMPLNYSNREPLILSVKASLVICVKICYILLSLLDEPFGNCSKAPTSFFDNWSCSNGSSNTLLSNSIYILRMMEMYNTRLEI